MQGIGGALLVPGSLAIISATFSGDARGKAIGTWSGFTSITTALGPVLGRWLVEYANWRWVFFVNLPLAAMVLALVAWRVPESRNEAMTGGLDWSGAALATVGLGGVVIGPTSAATDGWSNPTVLVSLLGGFAALTAFVAVEERHSGLASGINNAVSRAAGLLALAVFGIIVASAFGSGLKNRLAQRDLPEDARQAVLAQEGDVAGIQPPPDLPTDQQAAVATAVDESFVAGSRLAMGVAAGLAFVSAGFAWLRIDGKSGRTPLDANTESI